MNLDLVQIVKPAYFTNVTFPEIKKPVDKKEYNIFETLDTVCKLFAMEPETVLKNNKSKKREFMLVRQITMSLAKLQSNTSLQAIGKPFEKDHATVLHSVKTVKNLLDTNNQFREKVGYLFDGLIFPYI